MPKPIRRQRYMHGPSALVERGFPVLGLIFDDAARDGFPRHRGPSGGARGRCPFVTDSVLGTTALPRTAAIHPLLDPPFRRCQAFMSSSKPWHIGRGLQPGHATPFAQSDRDGLMQRALRAERYIRWLAPSGTVTRCCWMDPCPSASSSMFPRVCP